MRQICEILKTIFLFNGTWIFVGAFLSGLIGVWISNRNHKKLLERDAQQRLRLSVQLAESLKHEFKHNLAKPETLMFMKSYPLLQNMYLNGQLQEMSSLANDESLIAGCISLYFRLDDRDIGCDEVKGQLQSNILALEKYVNSLKKPKAA
jgi:hypothetical protein